MMKAKQLSQFCIVCIFFIINNTATYYGNKWTVGGDPTVLPLGLRQMAVGYDALNNRIILIGGNNKPDQHCTVDLDNNIVTDYGWNFFNNAGMGYDWGKWTTQLREILYMDPEGTNRIYTFDVSRIPPVNTLANDYISIPESTFAVRHKNTCLTSFTIDSCDYLIILGGKLDTGHVLATTTIYNISNSEWIHTAPDMLEKRFQLTCNYVQHNYVYAIGGNMPGTSTIKTIEKLDVSDIVNIGNQVWIAVGPFPTALEYLYRTESVVVGRSILVIGGALHSPVRHRGGYPLPHVKFVIFYLHVS